MPTSTAGRAESAAAMRANGFTLVELMVVIAVLAVATGAVVLTVRGSDAGPRDSAARFAGRLAAARDEAIVASRPVRAWVTPSGYGFDQYRSGGWQPLDRGPLRREDWPPGTALSGRAQGGAVRLRFDSLGLPDAPAELRLSSNGRSATVRLAANGDVTVQ